MYSRVFSLVSFYRIWFYVHIIVLPYFLRSGLPATESTIALALRPFGYRSVLLGSWHLGHVAPHDPLSHSFDEWLGLPSHADMGCKHLQRLLLSCVLKNTTRV